VFSSQRNAGCIVPLAAKNNLDELYAKQRLLRREVDRLEQEGERLDPQGDADRCYILQIMCTALLEEESNLNATISDILERDLQR